MASKVWSTQRKWIGNLLPALCWAPLTVYGVLEIQRTSQIFGPGLAIAALGQILGWLGLNFFGGVSNRIMRQEFASHYASKLPGGPESAVFVGFASPAFRSLLDAHEDVGFLFLESAQLTFVGESHTVAFPRSAVTDVRFRFNIHTLLLVGRWVCVEGLQDGRHIRLQIEPREKLTMLGNFFATRVLRRQIETWRLPSRKH
jgi:hypothetical protein